LKAVHLDGNHFLVSDNLQGQTEVVGVHIFTRSAGRTLAEIDYQGATLRSIPIPAVIPYPYKFVAIPDGRFAHLDNDNDRIDFTDAQGNFICTVPMPDPSPEELQCAYGIVVGNRLIVSETGTRKLIQVDLTSYQASIFRDLSDYSTSWLGAIDYYDGVYYLCTYNKVLRFTESGAIEEVATFTKNNLVGLAVVDGYAYVIINCYPSEVDRIDLQTMTAEPIAADLGYPESFAYIPVNLTPPITR
ncbi:MAG TPA: hypothetical protein VMU02_08605, partial [bacterium]|nr:hypothetical protein [bacterium]